MSRLGVAPLSWISSKAAVKANPIHGQGLFATQRIPAGDVVAVEGGYGLDRAGLDTFGPEVGADAEVPVADGLFIGPVRSSEQDGGMIFSNHS